jgi:hypothetical protein
MNVNLFIEKYYTSEIFKDEIIKKANKYKNNHTESLSNHNNEMKKLYENMLLNNIRHSFYPCRKEVKLNEISIIL